MSRRENIEKDHKFSRFREVNDFGKTWVSDNSFKKKLAAKLVLGKNLHLIDHIWPSA